MNNERLINKLADSKPIRQAAQFIVYALVRTGTLNGVTRPISNPREFIKQLKDIAQKLKNELKEVQDNVKKQQPK